MSVFCLNWKMLFLLFMYDINVFFFKFKLSVYLNDIIGVVGYICSLSCCAEDVNVSQFVTVTSEDLI